ncbi:MAG: ABC transporter substrate-binding protein [Arcobacteraceae bacterium]|jgi:putative ABC transport system substrate-binding protein|nr:ABC transporter substrate-binding protein [Arcobacteraceae bacterium]
MKRNTIIIIVLIGIIFIYFINKSHLFNKQEIPTVAFISLSDVDKQTFKGFKEQMEQYGWKENSNIKYLVSNPANKVENLPSLVASVVNQNPTLIFVSSTPATQEVQKATQSNNIPVVFCPVNDPVASGVVKNLKSPEKNITGIRLPLSDIKRFEWLHLIAPTAKNILLPFGYKDAGAIGARDAIKEIAKTFKLTIIEKEIPNDGDINNYLNQLPQNIDAIYIPRESNVEVQIDAFVLYANSHKIPLCAPSYQQVEKGALFTYGFIHTELGKDGAKTVDRILKGVQVADIPVKTGTPHLVINEKVAKEIGLTFPEQAIQNAFMVIKK